jgi:hypothetical protein
MKVKIQTKDGSNEVKDLNRRKAIRERCRNCSAWCLAKVRNCEFAECTLHPYRTGNGKQDAKAREKAIREYCLWCSVGKHSEVTKCSVPDCPLYVFRKQRLNEPLKIDFDDEKRSYRGHFRSDIDKDIS